MTSNTESALNRFLDAQAPVYRRVVEELTKGKKQSHWMWFIFPQLRGLGQSPIAQRYGINDLEEAREYLTHPVLGERLRQCVMLMMKHKGKSAFSILGTPDDLKFCSCVTLFCEATSSEDEQRLFKGALEQFYEGKLDTRTRELLGQP